MLHLDSSSPSSVAAAAALPLQRQTNNHRCPTPSNRRKMSCPVVADCPLEFVAGHIPAERAPQRRTQQSRLVREHRASDADADDDDDAVRRMMRAVAERAALVHEVHDGASGVHLQNRRRSETTSHGVTKMPAVAAGQAVRLRSRSWRIRMGQGNLMRAGGAGRCVRQRGTKMALDRR